MSRISIVALVSATALLGLGACAPTIARQGFQVMDASPREVKIGEDTKSSVMAKLGSPSTVSTFEPNVWFYISQTTEKYTYHVQKVTARDVTVVTFDPATELVASVENLDLGDARHFAYSDRETPTRGRELTVLEQLLGNIGQGGLPPIGNDDPGQRPNR
jgi:outer membrane protein assembly factor BamE (lipoprotein component of BamABCDE complex)